MIACASSLNAFKSFTTLLPKKAVPPSKVDSENLSLLLIHKCHQRKYYSYDHTLYTPIHNDGHWMYLIIKSLRIFHTFAIRCNKVLIVI